MAGFYLFSPFSLTRLLARSLARWPVGFFSCWFLAVRISHYLVLFYAYQIIIGEPAFPHQSKRFQKFLLIRVRQPTHPPSPSLRPLFLFCQVDSTIDKLRAVCPEREATTTDHEYEGHPFMLVKISDGGNSP